MKSIYIALFVCVISFSSGCGKQEPAGTAKPAAPTTAAPTAPAAASATSTTVETPAPKAASSSGVTQYIDHTKDEVEFGLKRSLAGLESLLEDISDGEQVAAIKKDIADVQAKLNSL